MPDLAQTHNFTLSSILIYADELSLATNWLRERARARHLRGYQKASREANIRRSV